MNSYRPSRNAQTLVSALLAGGYENHFVPCREQSKKPYDEAWPQRTYTPADFQPIDNIGLKMGLYADGDLDCREAVKLAPSFLAPTPAVFGHRSNPLSHYLYEPSVSFPTLECKDPVPDAEGKHPVLLELRCLTKDSTVGKQTIMPGSIHQETGELIEWYLPQGNPNGHVPYPAKVDGPELVRQFYQLAAAVVLARHWPAPDSGRHDACMALAGVHFSAGVTEAEGARVIELIVKAAPTSSPERVQAVKDNVKATYANAAKGTPITGVPRLSELIDARAVEAFLKWSSLGERLGSGRKHEQKADGKPPVEEEWSAPIPLQFSTLTPLDADYLPGDLGKYAAALSQHTETPTELALLTTLGAVSTALAGKLVVEAEIGYFEVVLIWICVLLESGNRKTAVVDAIREPIDEFQDKERERKEPEIKEAASKHRNNVVEIDKLRRQLTGDSPEEDRQKIIQRELDLEDDDPQLPVLTASDVTAEALEILMQENNGRMSIVSDEGGLFDVLSGRYNAVPNLDAFLKGHVGGRVAVYRRSRRTFIPKAYLTICVAPQPVVMQGLRDKPFLRERGLLPRFLFAVPESPVGIRTLRAAAVPAELCSTYKNLITQLLEWQPTEPVTLRLSAEALVEWKAFQRRVEDAMAPGGQLERLHDWGSKLPGAALRIAGMLWKLEHLKAAGPTGEIQLSHIQHATNLCGALVPHAIAAFSLVAEEPPVTVAKHILAWLQKQKEAAVTRRDCFRSLQCYFTTVSDMTPGLTILVEHGYIRLQDKAKRSVTIEINPLWRRHEELA